METSLGPIEESPQKVDLTKIECEGPNQTMDITIDANALNLTAINPVNNVSHINDKLNMSTVTSHLVLLKKHQ